MEESPRMQIPNLPPMSRPPAVSAARTEPPEADASAAPSRRGSAARRGVAIDEPSTSSQAALDELRAGTPVSSLPMASLKAWFDTAARCVDTTYYGRNNLDGTLAWFESEVIEGYLEAYQATKSTTYLDKASRHLDMALQLRDSSQGWKDYRGLSLPAWQSTKYDLGAAPGVWAVHTGLMAHGLAKFSAMVKDGHLSAYQDKAATYLQAAKSALAVHDGEFVRTGSSGYYIAPKGFPIPQDGVNLPSNMNLAMAMAHLAVYQASGDTDQLDRATRIARTFQSTLTPTTDGGCTWHYTFGKGYGGWGAGTSTHTPTSTGNRTVEDTSHGALDLQAMRELYDAGVVFTQADMQRMGSQLEHVVLRAGTFPARIDGTGTAPTANKVASWSPLSPWSPSIAQRAFDQLMTVPLAADKVPPMAMRGMALLMLEKASTQPQP